MKKIILVLAFGWAASGISSCCKGGTGGHASLTCNVFHHAKPIPGATVYIKYNASDFPGASTSSYDAHLTAGNTSNQVIFDNLNCGDYYLYGIGYDSSLMLPVTGGLHFQIKYSERKSAETTTVPITE
ncbi:MAG TPA: hypothetical protein VNZ86_11760 [Bacteroidia bacterium]|nr:hypothetical protein [Bacteroidia bacterium]